MDFLERLVNELEPEQSENPFVFVWNEAMKEKLKKYFLEQSSPIIGVSQEDIWNS
jgi:hypothetical protein